MSDENTSYIDRRVMRIVLPVGLVRDMDAIILSGSGGYQTRAEFIVDAVHERISELSAEEIGSGRPTGGLLTRETQRRSQQSPSATPPRNDDAGGATRPLGEPPASFTFPTTTRESSEPLFGLHNRDYPSLWALRQLADLCGDHPCKVEDFYASVLESAWTHGRALQRHEEETGRKSTALFPTNPEKRKAAEAAFRSFAIGDYTPTSPATTYGPLFEWAAAEIAEYEGELVIAPTDAGVELLRAIATVGVDEPHDPEAARAFHTYLNTHAPGDHAGFIAVLRGIGRAGTTRPDLLERQADRWADWTENEVSTNTAGYIARSREWGLVEPKQIRSQYFLTDLGLDMAQNEPGELS